MTDYTRLKESFERKQKAIEDGVVEEKINILSELIINLNETDRIEFYRTFIEECVLAKKSTIDSNTFEMFFTRALHNYPAREEILEDMYEAHMYGELGEFHAKYMKQLENNISDVSLIQTSYILCEGMFFIEMFEKASNKKVYLDVLLSDRRKEDIHSIINMFETNISNKGKEDIQTYLSGVLESNDSLHLRDYWIQRFRENQ